MGDIEAQGTRLGAAAIGTWDLDITNEWGNFKQRLLVNPDMTGLYGTIPVKKVNFENDQVSFKMVIPFGDQEFEWDFAGKIAEQKLTAKIETGRGTQEIKGTKVVRRRRGRPNM